ncbi:isoaspartyl peptidase/L-asparaginase family protein [Dokdonella sp.]|uniref:isoaspartyl peptidase/L-asparaginase family protein n=1 Tax=Dokdonella sp. TaxID=2291710 RepID=UPI003C5C442A
MRLRRVISSVLLLALTSAAQGETGPVLVIHGGAGVIRSSMTPAIEADVRKALRNALQAGYAKLESGQPALEAVAAAVVVLENDPNFNAGKGAVFAHDGKNKLDASIMDGKSRRAGAIAGVETVRNPILLARAVMEESPFVMLAGKGAEDFAKQAGITLVQPSYFRTERRWQQLQKALADEKNPQASTDGGTHKHFGTVGALALDKQGNLAAGTSTGGMTNKRYDRIGDSPVIGAGTYADGHCAVSATGWGEFYIRTVAAHSICMRVELLKQPLAEAAEYVINKDIPTLGGDGGAIALGADGTIAMPFNTDGMFRGWVAGDGVVHVAIYPDEDESGE